jgi:hypothetical protein
MYKYTKMLALVWQRELTTHFWIVILDKVDHVPYIGMEATPLMIAW